MPAHLTLGRAGEKAAADYLRKKGYKILERNWRHKQWELDLICRHQEMLVFVEVKTRAQGAMASGADALTQAKQSSLIRAASQYLTKKDQWDLPCRFDLVSVEHGSGGFEVNHTVSAFELQSSSIGWQPF